MFRNFEKKTAAQRCVTCKKERIEYLKERGYCNGISKIVPRYLQTEIRSIKSKYEEVLFLFKATTVLSTAHEHGRTL